MLLIGGQGALNQHQMGSLQDLPHVDIMKPITKFASSVVTTERVADMCSMAFREALAGAPGPAFLEIGRDILDANVPLENAVLPAGGPLPRVDEEHRRPGRRRPPGRHPHQGGAARACCSAARCGPRAARRPRTSSSRALNIPVVHERCGPRHAAARQPAPPPPHPPLRVQQRRRDPDRRHAVRLPHGLRQAPAPGGHGRPDRHGLPHRRQEPRRRPRARGRPRRDPGRGRPRPPAARAPPRPRGVAPERCATRRSGSRRSASRG